MNNNFLKINLHPLREKKIATISNKFKNLCIRCGRERVRVKSWEEEIGYGGPVTVTENNCPNVECQKIVDSDNNRQRNKTIKMAETKQKRMRIMYKKRRSKSGDLPSASA